MKITRLIVAAIVLASSTSIMSCDILWFDTPPTEKIEAPWKIHDMSSNYDNPDTIWERQSFPIGNGAFGASITGGINRERIVLNENHCGAEVPLPAWSVTGI